jgi:hypothetical protein
MTKTVPFSSKTEKGQDWLSPSVIKQQVCVCRVSGKANKQAVKKQTKGSTQWLTLEREARPITLSKPTSTPLNRRADA